MKKFICLFITLLSFNISAQESHPHHPFAGLAHFKDAGGDRGGNGSIFQSPKRQGGFRRFETGSKAVVDENLSCSLLDFFESHIADKAVLNPIHRSTSLPAHSKQLDKIDASTLPKEVLNGVLSKLQDIKSQDPVAAHTILATIESYNWKFVDSIIVETKESSSSVDLSHVSLIEVVSRKKQSIEINKNVWDHLELADKVALVIHEALHGLVKYSYTGQSRRVVRKAVAELFAGPTEKYEFLKPDFLELFSISGNADAVILKQDKGSFTTSPTIEIESEHAFSSIPLESGLFNSLISDSKSIENRFEVPCEKFTKSAASEIKLYIGATRVTLNFNKRSTPENEFRHITPELTKEISNDTSGVKSLKLQITRGDVEACKKTIAAGATLFINSIVESRAETTRR